MCLLSWLWEMLAEIGHCSIRANWKKKELIKKKKFIININNILIFIRYLAIARNCPKSDLAVLGHNPKRHEE